MRVIGPQNFDGLVPTAAIADDAVTEAKMANDAISLTELKAGTDGELITWGTDAAPTTVAVGTATHVLTSNGSGAAPTFQAAGGGWAFVENVEASTSATIELGEGNIAAGYDYMIQCVNVDNSADQNDIRLQFGTGGTPTYQTSGYKHTQTTLRSTGPTIEVYEDAITDGIPIVISNLIGGTGAGEVWSGTAEILNPIANEICQVFTEYGGMDDLGPNQSWGKGTGIRSTAEVITGFKILPNTGTFITGSFNLYKRGNA